jgi:hypothetical protein
VIFVHGLIGTPEAWGEDFVKQFDPAFVFDFVDYSNRSVSGFHSIFTAVPVKIDALLGRFRSGTHQHVDPPEKGERGDALHLLQEDARKIAATRVDVVAHSMGGLATRCDRALDGSRQYTEIHPVPRVGRDRIQVRSGLCCD